MSTPFAAAPASDARPAGALLIDVGLPVQDRPIDVRTVVGVVLTFGAVLISGRAGKP